LLDEIGKHSHILLANLSHQPNFEQVRDERSHTSSGRGLEAGNCQIANFQLNLSSVENWF
jgi:hypothetical protein